MSICLKWLPGMVVFVSVSIVIFSGCATIKDEIYLHNVDIEGTVNQLPVHITDAGMKKNAFHVTPHLSTITKKTFSSSHIGRKYTGQIPDSLTDFKRQGLFWDLPSLRFGLDIDYGISDGVAFMAGVSSSTGIENQFTAGYAGFGFYSADTTFGFRLDAGMQYSENAYRGASIIVRTTTPYSGSSSQEVAYFLDRGDEFHLNFFASLTFNSAHRDWFANYFFQIGLSPQTLTSFTPAHAITTQPFGITHIVSDQRSESSVTWLSVTPGVFFPVGESRRVVLGLRLMSDIRSLPESSESGLLVIPMVQLDWGL